MADENTAAAAAAAAAAPAPEEAKVEAAPDKAEKAAEEVKEVKEVTPEVAAQVRKQLEFYFSDANFSKDKFLRSCAAKNDEGWVELATIGTFKRLENLGCTQATAIASCLKDSDVVVVSEDQLKVKRKNPLPEAYNPLPRTVYAKGFPKEATLDDISAVFAAHVTAVKAVWRRRFRDKTNKPSAFIEFGSEEDAKAVVGKAHKYGEQELLVMSKEDYLKLKEEERKERQLGQKREREEAENAITPGVLVKFSGVKEETTWHELKEKFAEIVERVAYIEFKTGEKEGTVRLNEPEQAKKLVEGTNGKEILGETMTSAVLEGEEEADFWKRAKEARQASKGQGRNKRRRR